jgi:hypothetical protein
MTENHMDQYSKKITKEQSNNQFIQYIANKIPDPGNVNDIKLKSIPDSELKNFLNIIKTLSRKEVNDLLIGLGKANAINPNENIFSTCSKKSMVKYYLRNYQKNSSNNI